MQILRESFIQAFDQLRANRLRSFLSLLGIMVGIFCIMAIKTTIDSLESNIRQSVDKIGSNMLYVSKFSFDGDGRENFWKISRRPNPNLSDYRACNDNLKTVDFVSFYNPIGFKTMKFENNTVDRAFALAVTEDYDKVHSLEFQEGRFLTITEYNLGVNKVVLGFKVANLLFGENTTAVGREVTVLGRRMEVIGVLKESGHDLLKFVDYDDAFLFSFEFAKSVSNIKSNGRFSGWVEIKGNANVPESVVRDDITLTMRKARKLSPKEENNFAINSLSILSNAFDKLFGVLNTLGWVIGGFALLVGMFSVANIIFVSVKERTPIIGIKKALGAKQFEILLEFLIESVVLCLIGGLMGLVLVFIVSKLLTVIFGFEIFISLSNALFTFLLSLVVGVVSGILPALQAAKLDPVEAMRA